MKITKKKTLKDGIWYALEAIGIKKKTKKEYNMLNYDLLKSDCPYKQRTTLRCHHKQNLNHKCLYESCPFRFNNYSR